jgi:hypothetical protein
MSRYEPENAVRAKLLVRSFNSIIILSLEGPGWRACWGAYSIVVGLNGSILLPYLIANERATTARASNGKRQNKEQRTVV